MQITFELKNNANQKVYESRFDRLLGETECGGYDCAGNDNFKGIVTATMDLLYKYKSDVDALKVILKGEYNDEERSYLEKELNKFIQNKHKR